MNDTIDEWRLRTGGQHGSQDPATQEFETQQQSLFVRHEMQRKFKQFPFNLYTQAVDWSACTLVNTLICKRLSKGVTEVCVCVYVSRDVWSRPNVPLCVVISATACVCLCLGVANDLRYIIVHTSHQAELRWPDTTAWAGQALRDETYIKNLSWGENTCLLGE